MLALASVSRTLSLWLILIYYYAALAEVVLDGIEREQPTDGDVKFRVHNRANRNGSAFNKDGGLDAFKSDLPLCVVVTHGWMSSVDSPSVMDVVQGYLGCSDINIVTVDWRGIAGKNYFTANDETYAVGQIIGDMVVRLDEEGICWLNVIHLIGHGFGAHAMGVAGNVVQDSTGEMVGRITGLNPAGPMFERSCGGCPPEKCLDKSDAEFVLGIHTDPEYGVTSPSGHADFYPNGGRSPQPACECNRDLFCSHKKALQYYSESICDTTAFLSTECSSYDSYLDGKCEGNPTAVMGYNTPSSAYGIFYLTTRGYPPYSE